jgi:hypothetical protein
VTTTEIARRRAAAQGLTAPRRGPPEQLVAWLGAVQAQEYHLSKWSIAQRLAGGTLDAVSAAIESGAILRTHVLRPTWHFVPRDDLRWMQELTSSRVLALMASNDRRNGVTAALVAGSTTAIAGAIERHGHLTRAELADVLRRKGVAVNPWLVSQLVIHAELRGLVCSGLPRGKQQTYALVDERAPRSRRLRGDEALAELAWRYFRSHGPATAKDFRWWSGLDRASATRAMAALGDRLESETIDGRAYVSAAGRRAALPSRGRACVIQPFDEIAVAYTESRDVIDPGTAAAARGWGLLLRGVMIDGELIGRWAPGGAAGTVRAEALRRLTAAERAAVDRAVRRFGKAISPRGADRTDPGRSRSRSTRTRSRSS